jgi:hypothetical protein
MATASRVELDECIAIVRDNIRELTERAPPFLALKMRRESQIVLTTRNGCLPNS